MRGLTQISFSKQAQQPDGDRHLIASSPILQVHLVPFFCHFVTFFMDKEYCLILLVLKLTEKLFVCLYKYSQ